MSLSVFIGVQTRNADDLSTWVSMQMQYGAYIISLGVVVSFIALVFASFGKTERNIFSFNVVGNNISLQRKENNIVFYLEDIKNKKPKFYPITGLNIIDAIYVRKILALADKSISLTLKEIIKNTDVTLEKVESLLPVLVSAGFAKVETNANGNSAYLFEIKNAEKQILELAKNKFPITLEDIIKATDYEIEDIKAALEKLMKIGFFIRCDEIVIFELNKEVKVETNTVYYYVFSEQNVIESHLQNLINEGKKELIGFIFNNLPVSIDYVSYFISLLKDNKAAFANSLYLLSRKEEDWLSLSDDDIFIRKLGYLSIKQGTEEEWNKHFSKLNKILILISIGEILTFLGGGSATIISEYIIFGFGGSISRTILSFLYVFICVAITMGLCLFLIKISKIINKKEGGKIANKLFEIPE
jgi:DNA-binding MarR family transcriptional regulator